MRYALRRKHAMAVFAVLLFLCAMWLFYQEGQISKELSTSTSVQDFQQADMIYPVGEVQYRKEHPRIVLDQQHQSYVGPVEVKRGNFYTETPPTKKYPLEDVQKFLPKMNVTSKKVDRLQKRRDKKKKSRQALIIPDLTLEERKEFEQNMHDYCNPPWEEMQGEEGKVDGDYQLHHVHVIARHGDRTPLAHFSVPNITIDKNFNCDLETGKEQLQSADLLSRFLASITAQDEALPSWPQMPWFLRQMPIGWKARRCEVGQLTPTGWLQLMKLGDHMKQAYTSKLVPHRAYFRNPNMTRFKSTITSRTQQSAFAFMFGFLPRLELHHGEWLKVAETPFFCPSKLNCSCAAFYRLDKKKQELHGAVQKNNSDIQRLLKTVAAVLIKDPKTKSLPGLSGQREMYSAFMCHKKPLPCGVHGCLSTKHIAKILAASNYLIRELRTIERGPHLKLARLSMHPLLTEIAFLMKRISHGASNYPRFAFYSGHDVTIMPLLDILGIGEYYWPPYAANVVFELWSKSESFFVRVLYNGRDKTADVRFCRGVLNVDGLCPLRYLLRFVIKDNMSYFNVDSLAKACQLKF